MKKIMFSDQYGLMTAVLCGKKDMTRRVIKKGAKVKGLVSKYDLGEIVAIAQSYKDAGFLPDTPIGDKRMAEVPGWTNKMFVQGQAMPHFIRIKKKWMERLQDISDEDCLREGIFLRPSEDTRREFDPEYTFGSGKYHAATPKAAFAALIEATCGRGTWNRNPTVMVYEFELLR